MIKQDNVVIDAIFVLLSWGLLYVFYTLFFGLNHHLLFYTAIYLLIHFLIFGLRYILKRKWINFIPFYGMIILSFYYLIHFIFPMSIISNTIVLFIYIGMMGLLSVSFSYFLSSLTEKLLIENVEIAFLKQLKSGYPLIIASTAILIWIAFYIPLTGRHPGFYAPWYSYILLTVVFAMGTGLLMVPIYFLLGKKYQLVLISLIFTLISLLIYFLILSGYIATLVIIGVILWLGISAIESLIHKNKKLGKT